MAKRIVKRTLANGNIEYAVESNRLFGFIPVKWHVITIIHDFGYGEIVTSAIFDSYREACIYGGFPLEDGEIVREEVVEEEVIRTK